MRFQVLASQRNALLMWLRERLFSWPHVKTGIVLSVKLQMFFFDVILKKLFGPVDNVSNHLQEIRPSVEFNLFCLAG